MITKSDIYCIAYGCPKPPYRDNGSAAFLDLDQDGFIAIYACNGTWVEGLSHGEKH